jgi:uncharacterized protein (TIGR02444 family)
MTAAAEAFWDYSLRIYRLADVADALLALQDDHGANVNIVLFALYAGVVCGTRLGRADFDRLNQAADPWDRLAVAPLRNLRRVLKLLTAADGVAAFREQVKELELAAERIAQSRLVAAVPLASAPCRDAAAASANLRLYLGEIPEAALATLLAAA